MRTRIIKLFAREFAKQKDKPSAKQAGSDFGNGHCIEHA
jgi:hypothetical protein